MQKRLKIWHLFFRESMRQRHTGDGREMSESRSRLGLGLSSMDSRHTGQDSNGLDLYYNSRPPDASSWGYQPPPPVITEQPKSSMQHFQPYERNYPNTLESLAEKVHSFALPGRRMSAGGQPLSSRYQINNNSRCLPFTCPQLDRYFQFLTCLLIKLAITSCKIAVNVYSIRVQNCLQCVIQCCCFVIFQTHVIISMLYLRIHHLLRFFK